MSMENGPNAVSEPKIRINFYILAFVMERFNFLQM
jgi:hypothetical protein